MKDLKIIAENRLNSLGHVCLIYRGVGDELQLDDCQDRMSPWQDNHDSLVIKVKIFKIIL